MSTKNIAAFFDIDGTIYRDSLMVEHFRTMLHLEMANSKEWYERAWQSSENWVKRQGDYEQYLDDVVAVYVDSLKGMTQSDVDFTAKYVIRQKADRVYKFTRSQIHWHHQQGHKVIFISGSPDFLVRNMAKKYGADHFRASKYIFEKGHFTGEILPMWDSKSKNGAINHFATKYNLDLDECYSYGDTNGDTSMMRLVGHPVAFNPARELLHNICKDEELSAKTMVVVERKDVIYRLRPKDIMTLEVEEPDFSFLDDQRFLIDDFDME